MLYTLVGSLKNIDDIFLNGAYFDTDVEKVVDSMLDFDSFEQFFDGQFEDPRVLEFRAVKKVDFFDMVNSENTHIGYAYCEHLLPNLLNRLFLVVLLNWTFLEDEVEAIRGRSHWFAIFIYKVFEIYPVY